MQQRLVVIELRFDEPPTYVSPILRDDELPYEWRGRTVPLQIRAGKPDDYDGHPFIWRGRHYRVVHGWFAPWWWIAYKAEQIFDDPVIDHYERPYALGIQCEQCWARAFDQVLWASQKRNSQCVWFQNAVLEAYRPLHEQHEANKPRCRYCGDDITAKQEWQPWSENIISGGYVSVSGIPAYCSKLCYNHQCDDDYLEYKRERNERRWLRQGKKQLLELKRYLRDQRKRERSQSPSAGSPPGGTSPSS